jgi:hypothetical protein
MYEIRCTVSDAKLASILKALSGLTFGLPSVTVVEDTEAPVAKTASARKNYVRGPYKPSKRKLKKVGGLRDKGSGAPQIVRDLISKSGALRISAKEMRQATMAQGYSAGGYSHAIKLLTEDGTIRPLGFGHYEVVKKPETAVQSV